MYKLQITVPPFIIQQCVCAGVLVANYNTTIHDTNFNLQKLISPLTHHSFIVHAEQRERYNTYFAKLLFLLLCDFFSASVTLSHLSDWAFFVRW